MLSSVLRYVAIRALQRATIPDNFLYNSSGSNFCSNIQRSTLFIINVNCTRSERACRRTVSVCTDTPETASTTSNAPSVTRKAAVTSDEKST
jgi:hypothetical protein